MQIAGHMSLTSHAVTADTACFSFSEENTLVLSYSKPSCGKHVLLTNQRQEMPAWYTYVTSLNKEPISSQQKSITSRFCHSIPTLGQGNITYKNTTRLNSAQPVHRKRKLQANIQTSWRSKKIPAIEQKICRRKWPVARRNRWTKNPKQLFRFPMVDGVG